MRRGVRGVEEDGGEEGVAAASCRTARVSADVFEHLQLDGRPPCLNTRESCMTAYPTCVTSTNEGPLLRREKTNDGLASLMVRVTQQVSQRQAECRAIVAELLRVC